MALASNRAILAAMADQIRSHYAAEISDLDLQVEPWRLFNPTPPTIDIYPDTPARDEDSAAFDDLDGGYRFIVRARVSGDEYAQQDLLLALMDDVDDLCVAAALTDDPTLNGYAASVSVSPPVGYGFHQDDITQKPLLGVLWPVLVLAGNS